jgi:hypothetical protein
MCACMRVPAYLHVWLQMRLHVYLLCCRPGERSYAPGRPVPVLDAARHHHRHRRGQGPGAVRERCSGTGGKCVRARVDLLNAPRNAHVYRIVHGGVRGTSQCPVAGTHFCRRPPPPPLCGVSLLPHQAHHPPRTSPPWPPPCAGHCPRWPWQLWWRPCVSASPPTTTWGCSPRCTLTCRPLRHPSCPRRTQSPPGYPCGHTRRWGVPGDAGIWGGGSWAHTINSMSVLMQSQPQATRAESTLHIHDNPTPTSSRVLLLQCTGTNQMSHRVHSFRSVDV